MAQLRPSIACPSAWAGTRAIARACAAIAGRTAAQEPPARRSAATAIQGTATPTSSSTHRLPPCMHQLRGTHGVSPAIL
eukprot:1141582-Lingulodinium_polyedra.AAC.1